MTGDPLGVDEDERGSDPSEVKSIGSRMIEEDGRRGEVVEEKGKKKVLPTEKKNQ